LGTAVGTPSFRWAMRLLVVPRSMPKIKGPPVPCFLCARRF
jgi:hypothetical protein